MKVFVSFFAVFALVEPSLKRPFTTWIFSLVIIFLCVLIFTKVDKISQTANYFESNLKTEFKTITKVVRLAKKNMAKGKTKLFSVVISSLQIA